MIEIVYRAEEETEENIPLRLPRNVKQMGEIKGNTKIYIDNELYKYVTFPKTKSEEVSFGVVLGKTVHNNNNTYIFAEGLIIAKTNNNKVDFNENVWKNIYDQKKEYYDSKEILGWFLTIPFESTGDIERLKNIHLDNFSGENKICLYKNKKNISTQLYEYREDSMTLIEGFYIYENDSSLIRDYIKSKQNINIETFDFNNIKTPQKDGQVNIKNIVETEIKKNDINKTLEKNTRASNKNVLGVFTAMLTMAALLIAITLIIRFGDIKTLDNEIKKISEFSNENMTNTKIETVNSKVLKSTEKTETENNKTTINKKNKSNDISKANNYEPHNIMQYYTVKDGETLFQICKKIYGNIDMLDTLKIVNNLDDNYTIVPNQKIFLP